MGFLADLRYFGPWVGPGRALRLARAKASKTFAIRRLEKVLDAPESEAELWARLGLPGDPVVRWARLRETWSPFTESEILRPGPGRGDAGASGDEPMDRGLAEQVLAGRQVLFGGDQDVGWPPRWDWRWEGTANAGSFVPDLRSTWEIQRLQGLLPLAGAARSSGEARFAAGYLEALDTFAQAHPGPGGTAWASALEVGLRLLALVQGLPCVVASEGFASHESTIFRLLDRHARRLAVSLSLDKVVPGNHLLGELAGLLAVGHLLPSARPGWWGGRDIPGLLEAEILRQFHPDGVSVEQSLTYELFILEFLTVAGEAARLREVPFSAEVRRRLAAAARHLECATLPGGDLPRLGDCDSGRGAWFGTRDPHRPGGSLDRLRRLLTASGAEGSGPAPGRGIPATDPTGPDPDTVPGPRDHRTPGGSRCTWFPAGGHAVLRTAAGDYLLLRAGPFGWGSRGPASHSHADWLAPVLVLGGEPVLVDPGVYGYDLAEPGRDAQRDWEVHSGIRPGPGRGPRPRDLFRWEDLEARAGLEFRTASEGPGLLGWVRWPGRKGPLLWQRSIHYNELRREWTLEDRLSGSWDVSPEWTFRFAPNLGVESHEAGVLITLPSGARYRLRFDPPGRIRLGTGIVSSAYGRRETAVVLVCGPGPETGAIVSRVEILPGA